MSLVLNGTDGLSDVDGSAATPAIRGTDANTGIFFPAADTIAFAEGGAEVMRIDSSGNVGIGTSSPGSKLAISGAVAAGGTVGLSVTDTTASLNVQLIRTGSTFSYAGVGGNEAWLFPQGSSNLSLGPDGTGAVKFVTNGFERARIDSSGNLLISRTDTSNTTRGTYFEGNGVGAWNCYQPNGGSAAVFKATSSGTQVGSIQLTTTTTAYNTSSDYRLKEAIAPMTGALAKVAALKPVTYKWKVDGSNGQGFIAHELAEVEPGCVTGEKDAVDAEGNPQYQGIDTSFLVATLTAAIQELKAIVDAQGAEIAALKGAA